MTDTIAALATDTRGALSVIRISGEDSFRILERIFFPFPASIKRGSYHGFIKKDGNQIDEVIVHFYPAPRSYTGENIVEINCHGGISGKIILEEIIDAGVRLAERGEFTKRAWHNGKMDLVQAEAVNMVIQARTEKGLIAAINNISGRLSWEIEQIRERLVHLSAHIEALLDFPEDEVDDLSKEQIQKKTGEIQQNISRIIDRHTESELIQNGIKIVIAGKPNAGKSSIFNALLEYSRAIVSREEGTTRDYIEESIILNGIPVFLTDTAGIRETVSEVERIGIEHSTENIKKSDIVIFVIDASRPFDKNDEQIEKMLEEHENVIRICNKCDLPSAHTKEGLQVSAEQGTNIPVLKEKIAEAAQKKYSNAETDFTVTERQQILLKAAQTKIKHIEKLIENTELEILSYELEDVQDTLSEITGKISKEEIIDSIFTRFCIGK